MTGNVDMSDELKAWIGNGKGEFREVSKEEAMRWQIENRKKFGDKALIAENKKLKEALKETLEIASRNESGDYIQRALAALGEGYE